GQDGSGASGSHENRHSSTTVICGNSAAWARTVVDFAVPFSPRTSTPPIDGDTAHRVRASARSSEPTTAPNGYTCTSTSTGSRWDVLRGKLFEGRYSDFPVGRRAIAFPDRTVQWLRGC